MKKFLFFLLIALSFLFSAQAQNTMTASAALNTNSVTTYHVYQIQQRPSYFSVAVTVTKTSGTVAGTVIAQGSIDGTNYQTIIPADTLTLANSATNYHSWVFDNAYYKYYRLAVATTGTQVSVAVARIFQRFPNN